MDDDGLQRGDEISLSLLKAIEESKISVIIFSENYASSKWCLDELVHILECRKTNGQMVIPVFNRVNPSDVRYQRGRFGDAFVKHEEHLQDIPEKLRRWRAALTEASNLSGWDSIQTRPDAKLVDEIVRDILKKLKDISPSSDFEGLFGLDSHIEQIKSLLCIEFPDFRKVGIWGMGGIGKTTIAGAIFNQFSSQFEGSCFIANVRKESEKPGGLHRLREQLLQQILPGENLETGAPKIPQYIKERLQRKKVIIVLDDVDNVEQLYVLAEGLDHSGPGSRIIITTRDKQVLHSYGVHGIYKLKEMSYNDALLLFCYHAFKLIHPPDDLMVLSESFIKYAQGNPLALKVLGSSLYCKSKPVWESALHKLKRISNPLIHNTLRISYDLLDSEEQNLFLDLACFFIGEDSDHVLQLLDGRYLSTYADLTVLIDRSLVSNSYKQLEMHDLLQEMGREIVYKEDTKNPGKRSRLWNHEDIYAVLKKNTGTRNVEAIFLDMSKIKEVQLSPGVFENMENLKLLKFYRPRNFSDHTVHLPQGLRYLPDELSYLHWNGYPLKALPSNFSAENLTELSLTYSKIEVLWEGTKDTSKLRFLDLSHSQYLTKIPDLSYAPELEIITLQNCWSLLEIPSSIECLTKLRILDLENCRSLKSLPTCICTLKSLCKLNLSSCLKLERFPEIVESMEHLESVYLDGTAIKELPSSIGNLNGLKCLSLRGCQNLDLVGFSKLDKFRGFSQLQQLDLGHCNLMSIPEVLCSLSSLIELNLSGNRFESLPKCLKQLSTLKVLSLSKCDNLQSIPELPLCLQWLEAMDCKQLESLPGLPSNLEELDESKLESLKRSYKENGTTTVQFTFINCTKLNNVLAVSKYQIQHMATALPRICSEKGCFGAAEINLLLPGSEIPEWFSCQKSGSSITIQLPQHWYNRNFIGFAVGAVLEYWLTDEYCSPSVQIEYHFETSGSESNDISGSWAIGFGYWPEVLIDSDILLIGYNPCLKDFNGDCTKASFECEPIDYFTYYPKYGCNVKCCGVCPLYRSETSSIQASILSNGFDDTDEDDGFDDNYEEDRLDDADNEDDGFDDHNEALMKLMKLDDGFDDHNEALMKLMQMFMNQNNDPQDH